LRKSANRLITRARGLPNRSDRGRGRARLQRTKRWRALGRSDTAGCLKAHAACRHTASPIRGGQAPDRRLPACIRRPSLQRRSASFDAVQAASRSVSPEGQRAEPDPSLLLLRKTSSNAVAIEFHASEQCARQLRRATPRLAYGAILRAVSTSGSASREAARDVPVFFVCGRRACYATAPSRVFRAVAAPPGAAVGRLPGTGGALARPNRVVSAW
jgi:hypothetical protein